MRLRRIALAAVLLVLVFASAALVAVSLLHLDRGATRASLPQILYADIRVLVACPGRARDIVRFIERELALDIDPTLAVARVCDEGAYSMPASPSAAPATSAAAE